MHPMRDLAETIGTFALAGLACVAGCGPPSDGDLRLSGTVVTRERMALPPGASVHILLEDAGLDTADRPVAAELSLHPEGPSPIPFTLEVDRGTLDPTRRYALRARITDAGGALRWLSTEPTPVRPFDSPRDLVLPVQMPKASPRAETVAFDCSGAAVTAQLGESDGWFFLPDQTVRLPRLPTASGARYGDGGVLFWSHGSEAILELPGEPRKSCREDPARAVWEDAKLRGVDFRAVGRDPGWRLEITRGGILDFASDASPARFSARAPEPRVEADGAVAVYRVEGGDHVFDVRLEGTPCRDAASDEEFATRVRVRFDDRSFAGCGRALH